MNYKITMNDGESILVPEEVGLKVLQAKSHFIRYGDRMFNLKSISRVEPEEVRQSSPLEIEAPQSYSRQRYLRALKSMLEGCRQVEGKHAKALADKMEAKYQEAIKIKEEVYESPIKDFYKVL